MKKLTPVLSLFCFSFFSMNGTVQAKEASLTAPSETSLQAREKLHRYLEQLEKKVAVLEDRLASAEQPKDQPLQLQAQVNDFKMMQLLEIEQIHSQISAITQELSTKVADENFDAKFSQLHQEIKNLDECFYQVPKIQISLSYLDQEIKKLEDGFNQIPIIQASVDLLTDKMISLDSEKSNKEEIASLQQECFSLQGKVDALIEHQAEMQQHLASLQQVEKTIKTLEDQYTVLQNVIKELPFKSQISFMDARMSAMNEEINTLKAGYTKAPEKK